MKSNFAIFIDSTGDLDKELREKYDIDYLPLWVSIEDGEKIKASLDYDQGISFKQFYQTMRDGKRIFTSQIDEATCREKWIPCLEKGMDILYIAVSTGLSASYNVGVKVAKELMGKYGGRKIVCIDSLISGYGQGEMAIKASEMREQGKSIDEIESFLLQKRLCFNQFGTVENLTALKKAGRVTASSAFFGNLFSVKPILISDTKGHNFASEKVKGRKKSIERIAELAVEACLDPENEVFYISDADSDEGSELAREEILNRLPNAKIHMGKIGPIIGASTGPGTVVVYVYGKEVTLCGE
ncbi:MAG TPA: hypothetical protein DEA63_00410 [Firmicutes bacterium]|nr:hypothetical protein [Bacillota bacterium]